MKNIVKVLRFKDNATRLYQLPAGMVLDRGTVVEVEFAGGSAFGVTVSKSYCGDSEESIMEGSTRPLSGRQTTNTPLSFVFPMSIARA